MIFDFLKKQNNIIKKRKIIEIMIISLNIPDQQKQLYLEAIQILTIEGLDNIYIYISNFIKELENDELNKKNIYNISGLKNKEIKEKQQELNSFSFLINNL